MNKFAKGSLAAGAGVVLLLGGAGTLAYWNDSAAVTGGSIKAGTLDLNAAEGEWTHGGEKIDDVSTWAMVPGDELTYAVDLELKAVGDNMAGTVVLEQDFVIGEGADDQITVDLDVDESKLPTNVKAVDGYTLEFVGEVGTETTGKTIPVQVTVSFPFDENGEQNSSKGAAVDLENITFTATQSPADSAVKN